MALVMAPSVVRTAQAAPEVVRWPVRTSDAGAPCADGGGVTQPETMRPTRADVHRRPVLAALAAALACVLTLGLAPDASAAIWPGDPEAVVVEQQTADARIASRVGRLAAKKLGPASSVAVIDVATGAQVYGRDVGASRIPASNQKLLTAVAALETLGPDRTFTTAIKRTGRSRVVTFVSGGDPALTNAKIRALARESAATLLRKPPSRTKGKRVVRVRLDDSLFRGMSKHTSWRYGGYPNRIIAPVRATTRSVGAFDDSARSAVGYYMKRLKKDLPRGWVVRYDGRTPSTSTKARTLSSVQSQPVGALVARMLRVSDNQVAEVLFRHLAVEEGITPTFKGGAKATRRALKRLGVDVAGLTIVDGSGLSPANRIRTTTLTSVLEVAADTAAHPRLSQILLSDTSLPIAGRTGSLHSSAYRFTSKGADCAQGEVIAKTGTLEHEMALSGYTVGTDGRLKAFSIVVNGLPRYGKARTDARQRMDEIAAAVRGCF